MYRLKILLLLFFYLACATAQDKNRISGMVMDSITKTPLISATVIIEGTRAGTLTNQYGWFTIEIKPNENLKISLIGYVSKTLKGSEVYRLKSPNTIYLIEKPVISKEVVVESESRREKTLQLMGYEQLTASQIKYTPSFGGESDIMKTLQLLPGVTSSNENSTKLNIRGGESDQNLVLIDGVQAFNPMHLLNFVSSFNTDAVSNVELLKGSIPAEYFGKLSSVLKINLKEGNGNNFHWGGGLSLLSSQLYTEGPIDKNSTYMFSFRRTYFDLLLQMTGVDASYSFNDFYGKTVYHFSSNDHLYLSGYWGLDYVSNKDDDDDYSNYWGNQLFHIKYNHLWGNSVLSDYSVCYSKYFADLNSSFINKDPFIIDYSFKNNNDINISNNFMIKTGGDLRFYNFRVTPELFSQSNQYYHISAFESNIYLNTKYVVKESFIFDIGLVYSYFKEYKTKTSFPNLEPRISFCYLTENDFSLKFAFIGMHQYIHIFSPYNYSLPSDVFYPSSKNLPFMKGNQVSIGASKIIDFRESEFDISADVYYNDMKDVPNFKNHFENADPFAINNQVLIGKGWSYGTEIQIAKAEGRLSGWLNYTWNTARRLFIGKNADMAYTPKFHKTHLFNAVINYNISESVKMGLTYVISSGQPITLPAQNYYINDKSFVFYDELNGYRLPYYSRLDLSVVYFFNMWGGKWELSGSVFNLLMRKNPSFLYYDKMDARFEKTTLGLIPTAGIKFHY